MVRRTHDADRATEMERVLPKHRENLVEPDHEAAGLKDRYTLLEHFISLNHRRAVVLTILT